MRLYALFAFLFLAGIYGCKKHSGSPGIPIASYVGLYHETGTARVEGSSQTTTTPVDDTLTIVQLSDSSFSILNDTYNCTRHASDTASYYTFASGFVYMTFPNPYKDTFYSRSFFQSGDDQSTTVNTTAVKNH